MRSLSKLVIDPNFTIYGLSDTVAQEYALKNNINFVFSSIVPAPKPEEGNIAMPVLLSVKDSGSSKAIVKWKSVSGATGYKIYRKTSGQNWKAIKTLSGQQNISYTDSGLKTGNVYYYTVKAYKKTSGKTIWSSYDKNGLSVVAGVSTLKLNKKSVTLEVGKYYNLKINGSSVKPKWESSNSKIASVNANGKVIANSPGTVNIVAILGGKKFTCKVVVKAKNVPVSGVNLNISSKSLYVGDSVQLAATVKPTNASNKNVKWSSGNTSIAKVSSNGKVTGVSVGTTTVTVKTLDGEYKAVCKITVKKKVDKGRGSVSGNITYFYNYYRGHVGDTGAKVYLIPTDGTALSLKKINYTDIMFLIDPREFNEHGIYAGKVDGTGAYVIQNVPVGEYAVLIISKETTDRRWYDNKETYYDGISSMLSPYLTDLTARAFAEAVCFNKYKIEWINIRKNNNTVFSHDFGISYT